jgi:hypothetical protein
VGRERIDRTANPLAAMMDESLEELEREDAFGASEGEGLAGSVPEAGERHERRASAVGSGVGRAAPVRRAGRRPGRPRGGRNSDPNMVPISAKIDREVRFAVDRVLAEQSRLQGRPVYMAEVIERLLRFYVERGDPYEIFSE